MSVPIPAAVPQSTVDRRSRVCAVFGEPYDELEWAMQKVESGKSEEHFSGREKEVMAIYSRLNAANRHKMLAIPVCEVSEELKARD